jgi:hypothetical protein
VSNGRPYVMPGDPVTFGQVGHAPGTCEIEARVVANGQSQHTGRYCGNAGGLALVVSACIYEHFSEVRRVCASCRQMKLHCMKCAVLGVATPATLVAPGDKPPTTVLRGIVGRLPGKAAPDDDSWFRDTNCRY